MRVKSKSAVLHMLLGSPNYISGQELANRLGVSRQTVGKCVQQLREEGYKIEATQRLGYKFLGDNNLVTAEVLTPGCIARWNPFIMLRWTPPTRRPSGC